MRIDIRTAATAVLSAATIVVAGYLAAGSALAQNASDDSSWKLLTENDDVSRGALFEQFAKTAQAAEPATFAFPSSFHFALNALRDTHGNDRKSEIFGIDISHWEGTNFPFDDVKGQSVSFVYTKATQGTNFADPTFDHNWKTLGGLAADKKVPRGAFHFLSSDPSMTGKAQADRFVDYVNLHGKFLDGDLRPALDLEWDVTCGDRVKCPDRWLTNHRTPAEITQTTADFVNEVNARTGRKILLYTNKSFLKDVHIDSTQFLQQMPATVKIWIFDLDGHDNNIELPNPANNLPNVLWQFTFSGDLPGFGKKFDVDVFKSKTPNLKPEEVMPELINVLVKDVDPS
jgi:lysozyme